MATVSSGCSGSHLNQSAPVRQLPNNLLCTLDWNLSLKVFLSASFLFVLSLQQQKSVFLWFYYLSCLFLLMTLRPTHYLELVNFWLQTGIMEHSELSLKIIEYFPDIKNIYIHIYLPKKKIKRSFVWERKGEWRNVLGFASQVCCLYLRHNILRDISYQELQNDQVLKYF